MSKIFLKIKKQKGYAILFTIVLISAISAITAGLTNTSYKQLILSSLAKDTETAFYQADSASDCALYAELTKPAGVFSSTGGTLNCGGLDLVVSPVDASGSYTINPTTSVSTSQNACFRIDVNKNTIANPVPSWKSALVSWWNFDGDTNDSIGGNNGTTHGGVTLNTTGCFSGSCYNFDSSSSGYISMPNTSSLQMAGKSFTFFALINPTIYYTTTNWAGIIGGEPGSASLGIDSSSSSLRMTKVNSADIAISNLSPTLSSWNYVAVTFDVTSPTNNVTYYLNGASATVSWSNSFISGAASNVIGVRTNGSNYFKGKMDEVMIFNRVLTSGEIQNVYDSFNSTPSSVTNTTISARGYNMCNLSSPRTVEREIQVNYHD